MDRSLIMGGLVGTAELFRAKPRNFPSAHRFFFADNQDISADLTFAHESQATIYIIVALVSIAQLSSFSTSVTGPVMTITS